MLQEIARWWRERTGPGKLALIALVLLFVSQFFSYYQSRNTGFLSIHSDFSTTGYYRFDPVKGGTGWEIHKWASYALMFLAAFHGSSLSESRTFRRFGFWLSLPIAFMAVTPGSITQPGGKMGIAALGLFLIAAIWNAFLPKPLPSPPPIPSSEIPKA